MGLCSWPQAAFLFSIPKVSLLLARLCCCQRPGDGLELGSHTFGCSALGSVTGVVGENVATVVLE